MCSKHSLVSSSSVRKGCKKTYQCVAGEETEALRCYGVFLRSHSNQYRARGKSWFLALCINSGVNNLSCVHLWCVDSLLLSVMTPNHCSSVSWPCSTKWVFRIQLSLMGGFNHGCHLGEGWGVQFSPRLPAPCRRLGISIFVLLALLAALFHCCEWKGKSTTCSGLPGVKSSYGYIPSERVGWPGLVGRKNGWLRGIA